MKRIALIFVLVPVLPAHAQVVPGTPKKFTTRSTGVSSGSTATTITGGGSASIGVPAQRPPTIVRTTTYISLSDARQWTRTDGRSVVGKLIAFEDIVVEEVKPNGAPAAPAAATKPQMPANPTVVKDGKARLYIAGKPPYEVPLEQLSEQDRAFVEGIKAVAALKK